MSRRSEVYPAHFSRNGERNWTRGTGKELARRAAAPHIPAMPDIAIRVENLTKRFGDVVAVENLSFDAREGEIVGLLGGNGAGSTSGHPALSLFDFRDGPAPDRVFPEPAHLRRRRRSGGIRAGAALWVGGGKPCLGRYMRRRPVKRHLLSDQHPARLAAADRLQPAIRTCIRRHARRGNGRGFLVDRFIWSVSLNVLHLGLGMATFLWAFRVARHRGQLLQMGE